MSKIENDLKARYDIQIIIIHWLSFLLIAALVPTGKILHETEVVSEKMLLYKIHILVGILVFVMTIYRSYLFFSKPRPRRLDMGLSIHNTLVLWVQRFFYIAMLILGISGLVVISTNGIGVAVLQNNINAIPAKVDSEIFEVHEFAANALILLFFAHVGGVVLHYYRHKENVLHRIFFN